ncbi:DUF7544 domain-containing protein [Halalkalicoccus subterraneus]|uniref:DUF7544 domain-containing protein n=1 Tax=Halalkalicoccus subterraneus TaxID=2675002 RepID=UPI000EFC9CB4|nr:DUF4013 domain-containing protein [Halalkalicoccus subterraneus]
MALYAIDNLDDAWAATREFLTPLSVTRLLVLAVIVFFVGGTGSNFGGGGGGGTPSDPTGGEANLDALWSFVVENAIAIGLIGGVLLLLVLGFTFVGALMEFVFVQSLRTDVVRFWGYSRSYLGEGLRLLGFRLVLSILGFLPAAVFLGFGLSAFGAGPLPEVGGTILVVLGILAGLSVLAMALVDSLTTAFIVPVMLVRETGVLDGWRAFWPALTGHWKQYLAYVVAAFVLNIALGIVFVIVLAIVALALGIPLGIVVAGTALLAEAFLAPVAIVFGVLFVLGMIIAALVAQVPIQVYLRYYALLILGDTNDELDPVPEVRRAVRSNPEGGPETI